MLIIGISSQGLKTVDSILVLNILGIEQLGLYTIALIANGIIYSVTNSISNVLYPRMQEAYGKSGISDTMRSYVIRPSLIMAVLLPAMIGILYFLIPMVVNLLIPKFELGIVAFKVIILSGYFFAMVNMSTGYLISSGKQKFLVLINVVVLTLIVGIAAMLDTHNWGLGGIALATGTGYFACFLIVSIYVLRHWADWNQTIIFLKDTTLPFFLSLVLILIIDNYWHSSPIGNAERIFDSMLQLSIFLVLYMPCIILSDRKTRLISDFVIPLFNKTEKNQ
jgi:O-antigen/teichoic acid export membrane protein